MHHRFSSATNSPGIILNSPLQRQQKTNEEKKMTEQMKKGLYFQEEPLPCFYCWEFSLGQCGESHFHLTSQFLRIKRNALCMAPSPPLPFPGGERWGQKWKAETLTPTWIYRNSLRLYFGPTPFEKGKRILFSWGLLTDPSGPYEPKGGCSTEPQLGPPVTICLMYLKEA